MVAGSDINVNGSQNLGGAVYISYGSIDMGGSRTLNSGAIYAKNDIRIHGSFILTYDKNAINNNVSIGGGQGSATVAAGSWTIK